MAPCRSKSADPASAWHNRVLCGDSRRVLPRLPAEIVDAIVTSPPYFRLRNYGHDSQIGLEAHVDHWVDELRLVARGLHRVLKPHGSLWLNLGDTYSFALAHVRDEPLLYVGDDFTRTGIRSALEELDDPA